MNTIQKSPVAKQIHWIVQNTPTPWVGWVIFKFMDRLDYVYSINHTSRTQGSDVCDPLDRYSRKGAWWQFHAFASNNAVLRMGAVSQNNKVCAKLHRCVQCAKYGVLPYVPAYEKLSKVQVANGYNKQWQIATNSKMVIYRKPPLF